MSMDHTLLIIYTIGSIASFLPQIIKLIRTKSADDFSLLAWVLFVVTSGTWCLYVWLYTQDAGAIFMSLLDAALNIAVLIQLIYYQKYPGGRKHNIRG